MTLTLPAGRPSCRACARRCRSLYYNLCDNAVKYNRPGGSVTVTAEKRGGETVLSVADTGIGIPYHQNRVFERFYRVDKTIRQLGGTGLAPPSSSTPRRCTGRLEPGASRTPEPRSPSTLTDNKAFEPQHGHWMSVPEIFCVLCKVNKLKRFPLYKTGI